MSSRRNDSEKSETPARELIRHWLLEEIACDGTALDVEGPLFRSRNCALYRATGSDLPEPLAVKVCLRPDGPTPSIDDARQQFTALNRVAAGMSNGASYGVPRTFPFLVDRGCLVMEWIEGHTLRHAWTNWSIPIDILCDQTQEGGAWLRRFHAAHPLTEAPLDIDDWLGRLRRRLSASGLQSRTVKPAVELLVRSAPEIAGTRLPASWVHGDCKGANLLLAGNRVFGVDISLRHEGPVILDLAQFLIDLHLNCLEPSALRLAPWRIRLERAFLAGYGTSSEIDKARLWIQLVFILMRILDTSPTSLADPGSALSRLRLRIIANQTIRQLREHLRA